MRQSPVSPAAGLSDSLHCSGVAGGREPIPSTVGALNPGPGLSSLSLTFCKETFTIENGQTIFHLKACLVMCLHVPGQNVGFKRSLLPIIFWLSLTKWMCCFNTHAAVCVQVPAKLESSSLLAGRVIMAVTFVLAAMLGLTAYQTSWSTNVSTRALTSTSFALVRVCVCEAICMCVGGVCGVCILGVCVV